LTQKTINKQKVKELALEAGFDFCGIAHAGILNSEQKHLQNYLSNGWHGEMAYMEKHFEKRCDPQKLVEGSKSIIVLLHNYFPKTELKTANNFKIARYAYGEDYHHVLKEKMGKIIQNLEQEFGAFSYRIFTDSAPVLERAWAVRAGLGAIGKNGNLIVPGHGSWFFISEIICSLDIEADEAFTKDLCGKCSKCLDACPTSAFADAYKLDARKCLSYLSIEKKGEIPEEFKGKGRDFIFGCDICQEVCPHNRHAKAHTENLFDPNEALFEMNKDSWEKLSKEEFRGIFKKSAVKRSKYEGLMRNILFQKNK